METVKGSGKDGRILKGDLINLMGVNPPPSEEKLNMVRKKVKCQIKTNYCELKQAQENAALLTTLIKSI